MRWLACLLLLTGSAAAETPPAPRPDAAVEVLAPGGSTGVPADPAVTASARPVRRVAAPVRAARVMARVRRAAEPRIDAAGEVRLSERPDTRPDDLLLAGSRSPRGETGGGLCGRASIKGERIAPVTGPGGCGIPDAVRITRVSGVDLIQPARMDCTTAQALDDWTRTGLLPIVGRRGGGAVALRVAAGYSCRSRNNRAGARMSEHALGHAIDISAIQLANGQLISILTGWHDRLDGPVLRALWQAACGPFGTVLGPESDRYHRNHFHFDTARYRSGSYCR